MNGTCLRNPSTAHLERVKKPDRHMPFNLIAIVLPRDHSTFRNPTPTFEVINCHVNISKHVYGNIKLHYILYLQQNLP